MHRKIAHQNGTESQKGGSATGKFPVGVELGRRLVALFWWAGRQRCWTLTWSGWVGALPGWLAVEVWREALDVDRIVNFIAARSRISGNSSNIYGSLPLSINPFLKLGIVIDLADYAQRLII